MNDEDFFAQLEEISQSYSQDEILNLLRTDSDFGEDYVIKAQDYFSNIDSTQTAVPEPEVSDSLMFTNSGVEEIKEEVEDDMDSFWIVDDNPNEVQKIINSGIASGMLARIVAKAEGGGDLDYDKLVYYNKVLKENQAQKGDVLQSDNLVAGFALDAIRAVGQSLVSFGAAAPVGAAGAAVGAGVGSFVPVVGSAAGATAGFAGATSLAIEYANSMMSSLQEAGVDIYDDDRLESAFNDPEKMKEARQYALKRGIPIAVFDAISGGTGGKIAKGLRAAGRSKTASALGEVGVQMGLGMAGETSGQLVAGDELSPREILLEGFAELVPAAPGMMVEYAKSVSKGKPLPESAVIDQKISNDIREENDSKPEAERLPEEEVVEKIEKTLMDANKVPDFLLNENSTFKETNKAIKELEGFLATEETEVGIEAIEKELVSKKKFKEKLIRSSRVAFSNLPKESRQKVQELISEIETSPTEGAASEYFEVENRRKKVQIAKIFRDNILNKKETAVTPEQTDVQETNLETESNALDEESTVTTEEQRDIDSFFNQENESTEVKSQNLAINKTNAVEDVSASKRSVVNIAELGAKAISKILPKVKIVMHQTNDQYLKYAKLGEGRAEYNPENTTIHINLSKAKNTTVPHEIFHAVLMEKVKTDPAIAKAAERMVLSVQKALPQNSELGNRIEAFAKQYEGQFQNEERLAELVGILSSEYRQLNRPSKNVIAEFLKSIARKFGIEIGSDFGAKDADVIDLLNVISRKTRTGETITEADVKTLEELDNGTNPIGSPTTISKPSGKQQIDDIIFKNKYNNSLVNQQKRIDIDVLINEIVEKNQKVWFWVADQLGINEEMGIDGGPSFAHQNPNDIWASSMSVKGIENNISKTDYLFIISGSPTVSKLFSKSAYDFLISKLGNFNEFKTKALEVKPTKVIKETLEKYNSWEELRETTDRKPFLIALNNSQNTPNTNFTKYVESINGYTDLNTLRDGFYAENGFEQNDIMLVLKPTGVRAGANHSTYDNTVEGEVIGVPNKKVNALDIMPEAMREKYAGSSRTQASQAIAPYGSGRRSIESNRQQKIDDGLSKASGTTQVATTGGSYATAANIINGFDIEGDVLDYGAGLGLGTDVMSKRLGRKVDSFELNTERWEGKENPTYTSAKEINKKYDAVVSLNVVNVVPKDVRDFIIQDIFSKLNEGGTAIISSRGFKGDISNTKNFEKGPEEKSYIVKRKQKGKVIDVYQKGFDGNELVDYVQELLGVGAVVTKNNTFGKAGVVVTKAQQPRQQKVTKTPKFSMGKAKPVEDFDLIESLLAVELPDPKKWQKTERTGFSKFIIDARRKVQDKYIDFIKLQEDVTASLKEQGIRILENQDLINALSLFDSKTNSMMKKTTGAVMENVASLLKKAKISNEEFGDILYALTAIERNRELSKRAQEKGIKSDKNSGMTDIEAKEILDRYGVSVQLDDSGVAIADPNYKEIKNKNIREAVEENLKLLKETRDRGVESGLYSKELIDSYEKQFKYYAPLRGFADPEIREKVAKKKRELKDSSVGFKLGDPFLEMEGRTTKADNPFASSIALANSVLINANKNKVKQRLFNLAQMNPNAKVWKTHTIPTNKIQSFKNSFNKPENENGLINVFFNGKEMFVEMSQGMANSMNGTASATPSQFENALNSFAVVNRFLSSVITSYNPEFILGNFTRDMPTAIFNLMAENEIDLGGTGSAKTKKLALDAVGKVMSSMRAIYNVEGLKPGQKKQSESSLEKRYREFVEDGAKTGWFYAKSPEELAKSIEGLMDDKGKGKKTMKALADYVDRVNTSVENAIRLSTYSALIDAGVPRFKAAEIAKELTVNFNKSGEWGRAANSLYLFFNASTQGTARLLKSLKPRYEISEGGGKKLVVTNGQYMALGIVTLGAMNSLLNEMMSDRDEDESYYSKIPEYIRERNIVIMNPFSEKKGDYFKIPLPYGLNVFYVIGNSLSNAAQGIQSQNSIANQVFQTAAGSFSPINYPNSESTMNFLAKFVMPTVGQPFLATALNENYFGSKIYNENFPFATAPKPDSQLGRGKRTFFEGTAKAINKASGGDKYTSGFVDVNPDLMAFWADFMFGGTGKFIRRTSELPGKLFEGKEVDPREVPFLRVFAAQTDDYNARNKYYEDILVVGQLYKKAKGGGFDDPIERKKVVQMERVRKSVTSTLRKINKAENLADKIQDAEKRQDRFDYLERLEKEEIKKFLRAYKKYEIDDLR